jgi:hypothetical protein
MLRGGFRLQAGNTLPINPLHRGLGMLISGNAGAKRERVLSEG